MLEKLESKLCVNFKVVLYLWHMANNIHKQNLNGLDNPPKYQSQFKQRKQNSQLMFKYFACEQAFTGPLAQTAIQRQDLP